MRYLAIPPDLTDAWKEFRAERVRLRKRLREDVSTFWRLIPRRRKRIMPIITYTDRRTVYEPSPMDDDDRLGMYVRWRLSGVLPMLIDGKRRLRATWDWEWDKDRMPKIRHLIAGGLHDPAEQENFRYYWERIHAEYDVYLKLASWFHKMLFLHAEMQDKLQSIKTEYGELHSTGSVS